MQSEVENQGDLPGVAYSQASPQSKPSTVPNSEPKIRVCEIYESLQGEGLLVGTPSIFVRTSGCNLRCWFCDTPFASWKPEGDYLSIAEIESQCRTFQAKHCVLTGGEPMIFSNIDALTKALRMQGLHLTIETAGTVYHPVECDLMSISPKLSGSTPNSNTTESWTRLHEQRRENLAVVQRLIEEFPYQLKFVVDNEQDAEEVLDYINRLETHAGIQLDRERLLIMPQGTNAEELAQRSSWLIPWCKTQDLRFCPRSHIAWFGNQRGT